jgi:alanyl-tRNA synthetase
MTANELRQKYLDFFVSKGHKIIPPAPLIPENDPTTMFNSAGMQQLVPYILGQKHPQGTRLVDSQPSVRLQGINDDIDEVGDNRHTTFFEMLGNWSLGDYFKKEQIPWIWEFLTQELKLSKTKLYVSVFAGTKDIPADQESTTLWKSLGVPDNHIFKYGDTKNWWSRSGPPSEMPAGEPGGATSEIFYEFTQIKHDPKFGEVCHPNCDCGRFLEIGNCVFMEYKKEPNGTLSLLPSKNVDFGGGFERLLAATLNESDIFKTELFYPLIQELEKSASQKYQGHQSAMQITVDHLKSSTFLIAQGLEPSNKQQGYLLRRLIRRAIMKMRHLGIEDYSKVTHDIVKKISVTYSESYPETKDINKISAILLTEINRFEKTLTKGLREFNKLQEISGQAAFNLLQTYGFPLEMTEELAKEKGLSVDIDQFKKELEKHSAKSRTASAGMFKGGLADTSATTTQYHTTTHLLHQAMRDVLGNHVQQSGSNITVERLRFDFTHQETLTNEQIQKITETINHKIAEDLPVAHQEMPYQEAVDAGALAFFRQKYPEQVTVYSIGDYSKELCGGPHVTSTGKIGKIKVDKQKALGQGLRRVYLKFI